MCQRLWYRQRRAETEFPLSSALGFTKAYKIWDVSNLSSMKCLFLTCCFVRELFNSSLLFIPSKITLFDQFLYNDLITEKVETDLSSYTPTLIHWFLTGTSIGIPFFFPSLLYAQDLENTQTHTGLYLMWFCCFHIQTRTLATFFFFLEHYITLLRYPHPSPYNPSKWDYLTILVFIILLILFSNQL